MLEIHELLDRFEILNPDNMSIANLRRTYIDKDLTSIFKLVEFSTVSGSAEDLRKAVMEQNLHSIFRLIQNDDLKKLVLDDNIWSLWKLLPRYTDTYFTSAFKNFLLNDIKFDKDCFSRGQLQSKLWLINELKKLNVDLGTVYLCAGWYATLAVMLFESEMKIDKIRSFDIDPTCQDIADAFNKPWFLDQWRFKAVTKDIMHITYDEHWWEAWSNANNRMSKPICDNPNTIINTSCEHIENFNEWYKKIPNGKLVILQGNDYFEIKEHVNCSTDINDFSKKSPMKTVLYEGSLELPKYTRFMKIGYK